MDAVARKTVPRRLLVSFSGGETSAFMTHWILRNWARKYDVIVVVFANTGQENEETLEFARDCDERMGFGTVWIEAVIGERGVGTLARVVTFETADRTGAPFEALVRKYGIPNTRFPHCTRELKERAITAYAKSLGWGKEYDTAIGIRSDEIDRMNSDSERRLVYPLASKEAPYTKPMINSWWDRQNFRLRLKGYQGNCKWCWKKSMRKHLTIASESPEKYDFPLRMEAEYPLVGPEFLKDPPPPPDYSRSFFRQNTTARQILDLARQGGFTKADDDAVVFDDQLDLDGGCGESCEVFADA